jgi:acetyltransferase-like isoleucine patch superfamily enzyme
MGEGAVILYRHFFDCTASVTLGDFAWVGGLRSNFYTHQLRTTGENADPWGEIHIGECAFINGGCTLAPNTTLADRSILAGMAFGTGDLTKSLTLYGGLPAVEIKELDAEGFWFDVEHRRYEMEINTGLREPIAEGEQFQRQSERSPA